MSNLDRVIKITKKIFSPPKTWGKENNAS